MKKLPDKIPKKIDPARMAALIEQYYRDADLQKTVSGYNEEYYYWDELKYRIRNREERENTWALMKLFRSMRLDNVPFTLLPMKYHLLPEILHRIHESDRYLSGTIQVHSREVKPEKRYLIQSLMEEAIASSILEGAVTTRRAAREMLEKRKKPKNSGERMVFNNYETMQLIKNHLHEPLTPDLLLLIQQHITRDTIRDEDVGAFRDNNEVTVVDPLSHTIHHIPPDYTELPDLVHELCRFVNSDDEKRFIHPIIKGIIIHFLIGYIHPFNDGNGRTARSLFYWYTLSKGYWLMEYLSISRVILRTKTNYARAYLYSEYDENDLTYFIRYHVRCMNTALEDLTAYIETVQESQIKAREIIRSQKKLTRRQGEILIELIENRNSEYPIFQIAEMFSTVYETARTDLRTLEMAGLVSKIQRGKTFYYYVNDENIRMIRKNNPTRDLFGFDE